MPGWRVGRAARLPPLSESAPMERLNTQTPQQVPQRRQDEQVPYIDPIDGKRWPSAFCWCAAAGKRVAARWDSAKKSEEPAPAPRQYRSLSRHHAGALRRPSPMADLHASPSSRFPYHPLCSRQHGAQPRPCRVRRAVSGSGLSPCPSSCPSARNLRRYCGLGAAEQQVAHPGLHCRRQPTPNIFSRARQLSIGILYPAQGPSASPAAQHRHLVPSTRALSIASSSVTGCDKYGKTTD